MRTMVVALGVTLLGLAAGCNTQETTKTQPGQSAPTKVEAATTPAPKPIRIEYVTTPSGRWMVHDMNRPAPPVITPGAGTQPSSDAIVLFDGTDLSKWTNNYRNIWVRPLPD